MLMPRRGHVLGKAPDRLLKDTKADVAPKKVVKKNEKKGAPKKVVKKNEKKGAPEGCQEGRFFAKISCLLLCVVLFIYFVCTI